MKLVIFDLDGTLVDSLADLAEAVNYALSQFNFPVHPLESFRYFVGNGVPKLIERALPEDNRSQEQIEQTKEIFGTYYNMHCTDKTRPYDGIEKLLADLKRQGIKLAVASNKSDEFARLIVKHFFGDTFDCVSGGKADIPKKPAPDIVFGIMKELGVSAEDTYFIGDSNVDMFTAQNAGIKSIGCLWGFRTKEELVSGGADFIAEKPDDIYKIIEREYRI